MHLQRSSQRAIAIMENIPTSWRTCIVLWLDDASSFLMCIARAEDTPAPVSLLTILPVYQKIKAITKYQKSLFIISSWCHQTIGVLCQFCGKEVLDDSEALEESSEPMHWIYYSCLLDVPKNLWLIGSELLVHSSSSRYTLKHE